MSHAVQQNSTVTCVNAAKAIPFCTASSSEQHLMQRGALRARQTPQLCQPRVTRYVVAAGAKVQSNFMCKAELSSQAAFKRSLRLSWLRLTVPGIALSLAACVAPPPRAVAEVPSAPPPTDVYVYPNQGQSDAQLDRDRYECNTWAVKQSRYDPSEVHAEAQRVHVIAGSPPGANTAVGAVGGAVVGSVLAGPRDAGAGALVGAVAGAIMGAASDSAQQDQAARTQARYDARTAAAEQRAQDYRRAISACLEGRGYTVK